MLKTISLLLKIFYVLTMAFFQEKVKKNRISSSFQMFRLHEATHGWGEEENHILFMGLAWVRCRRTSLPQ